MCHGLCYRLASAIAPAHAEDVDAALDVGGDEVGVARYRLRAAQVSPGGYGFGARAGRDGLRAAFVRPVMPKPPSGESDCSDYAGWNSVHCQRCPVFGQRVMFYRVSGK